MLTMKRRYSVSSKVKKMFHKHVSFHMTENAGLPGNTLLCKVSLCNRKRLMPILSRIYKAQIPFQSDVCLSVLG